MGGRERERTPPGEGFQDRGRERASLRGVRAAPDLIEQHERAGARVLQNVPQLGEVRREGGQARRDGLTISDIGEYPGEQRQRRLRSNRRDNAALRHETQQSDRLDQYGLAAGVRARYEHRVLVGSKNQVERNNVATTVLTHEEWVPAIADLEGSCS